MSTVLDVYQLLREATAMVCTSKGTPTGSAVFIYPRHLLTAAHVIDAAGDSRVVKMFDGRSFRHTYVVAKEPHEKIPGSNWPLPDLAVLRIDDEGLPDHVCVELSDALPKGERCCVDGYVKGITDKVVQDRAFLTLDSPRTEDGTLILQFTGNIQEGMSGGGVLDPETGQVVGLVKADRDQRQGPGGFAVAGETIRERLPGPWARNVDIHDRDSAWQRGVRASRQPNVERSGRERYLNAIAHAMGQSPLLPPDVSLADLRQPVRLRSRRLGRGGGSSSTPVADAEGGTPGLGSAFIWDPLRSPWEDVAIVAGPGMGKSWLLTYHVGAIADQQLRQLASQPELDEEVEIPVWVGGASLARQLPAVPTRDQAMKALAAATHLTVGTLHPEEIEALFASASEGEKLILCVDGLDEVPADLRSRLGTALIQLEPSVRQLIVTTREAAGQLLAEVFPNDFEEFSIEGFTDGDVRRFVKAWHRHEPAAATRVHRAIGASDHLKQLIRVPLLLGFICRLVGPDDRGTLPKTRSQLYRAVALDLLSGRWRESGERRAEGQMSDPVLRLKLLSRAVGSLVTGWRTRPEEFAWSEVNSTLRADPEYKTVREGAERRYRSRERSRTVDRETDDVPGDVVLWEFEHDGLLVRAFSSDSRPMVRFTHLVFAELCIAMSLAGADADAQSRMLDLHRWFDDEWSDIIPIACGVADDPKALLAQISSVPSDPWGLQARLEGRSMAEVPEAVSSQLLERLVERLESAINGSLRSDLGRCLVTLDVLVSADVGDSRHRVRRLLEEGAIKREGDANSIAVMLCHVGDSLGVERCVAIAGDDRVPIGVRSQAMKALCASSDSELVRVAVKPVGDLSESARSSLVSALVHGDAASVEVALEMVQDDKLDLDLRATIAVGLIYAGADQAATVLLEDPRSSRTVRARAVTALLQTGNQVPEGEAEALAEDPNVVPEDRLDLVHALVLRGDRKALAAGAELAVDGRLNWEKRQALSRTMLSTGALGRSVLAQQALSDLRRGDDRLQALLALLERRDTEASATASKLIDDRKQLIWVRLKLASALLESVPGSVKPRSVLDLLEAPELADAEMLVSWEELLAAILTAELPALLPHAERRIAAVVGLAEGTVDGGQDPIPPNAEATRMCRRLGTGGGKGRQLLERVIGSAVVELETRIQAALVLAQVSKAAEAALEGLLGDKSVPESVRERLVVLFARLGTTATFHPLLGLMPQSEPAYSALYRLLSSASATEEMVKRGVAAASEAIAVLNTADLPMWDIEFDALVDEISFEANSEAERSARRNWLTSTLRDRVFGRLLSLLLPGEKEELYRVGNFENNEVTRNWLATRIPNYKEIAAVEVDRLAKEIAENPQLLPSPIFRGEALHAVELTAGVLRELVDKSTEGDWDHVIRLLIANEQVLESDLARATFEAALLVDDSWPTMAANQYLLRALRSEHATVLVQILTDESAILNRLKTAVDAGDSAEALSCGAVGMLRWPRAAAVAYYTSLGAELAGLTDIAEKMMEVSANHATARQAIEGRASLIRTGRQHNFAPERIEKLRELLGEAIEPGGAGEEGQIWAEAPDSSEDGESEKESPSGNS